MKIRVEESVQFRKNVKNLHKNQKIDLDKAVLALLKNPDIGESKIGDLQDIMVYKFRMVNQLTLIAYSYYEDMLLLRLIAFGSHENFYRDLKQIIH